MLQEMYRVE